MEQLQAAAVEVRLNAEERVAKAEQKMKEDEVRRLPCWLFRLCTLHLHDCALQEARLREFEQRLASVRQQREQLQQASDRHDRELQELQSQHAQRTKEWEQALQAERDARGGSERALKKVRARFVLWFMISQRLSHLSLLLHR